MNEYIFSIFSANLEIRIFERIVTLKLKIHIQGVPNTRTTCRKVIERTKLTRGGRS